MSKKYKAYIYTCDKHELGEFVRLTLYKEYLALTNFSKDVPHATNCWIKGCQEKAMQVRLVEVE
jgi:hypothetical protein